MSARRAIERIPIVIAVVLMTIGVVGFVVALVLNVFVLDRYNAYGEVPIPGAGTVHLPAGDVTVNLRTRVISSPTGGGLPVPPVSVSVRPPAGVAQPEFEESVGMTTTVNNDSRRRLWWMRVSEAGDYQITTDGQVGAYIGPKLTFGQPARYRSFVVLFPVVFGVGLLDLIVALWWAARMRRRPTHRTEKPATFIPEGEGIRVAQLNTITALRDSGALTAKEFAEEKRRILRGH